MTLKKGKEQDGMMLAKVKEQDGIMLSLQMSKYQVSLHQRLAATQLTNTESSSYTFTIVDYFIGLRPPNTAYLQLSTTSSDCVLLNTDTSGYLQPSITSSDCVLQTQIHLVIYNCQLLHRTASS